MIREVMYGGAISLLLVETVGVVGLKPIIFSAHRMEIAEQLESEQMLASVDCGAWERIGYGKKTARE